MLPCMYKHECQRQISVILQNYVLEYEWSLGLYVNKYIQENNPESCTVLRIPVSI